VGTVGHREAGYRQRDERECEDGGEGDAHRDPPGGELSSWAPRGEVGDDDERGGDPRGPELPAATFDQRLPGNEDGNTGRHHPAGPPNGGEGNEADAYADDESQFQ